MKQFVTVWASAALLCIGMGTAYAGPSAKSTVDCSATQLLGTELGVYEEILYSVIHTSEQKDLIVDVSLECGLMTRTRVKGKNGDLAQAAAEAGVMVQVILDEGTDQERLALPGPVTFCKRAQELTAKFGGIIESCTDKNLDGTIVIADECEVTEEELQLILQTMSANSFNFILDDLGAGDHTISIQAMVDTCSGVLSDADGNGIYECDGEPINGDVDAKAWVGKGSATVDEVRFIKGEALPVLEP